MRKYRRVRFQFASIKRIIEHKKQTLLLAGVRDNATYATSARRRDGTRSFVY